MMRKRSGITSLEGNVRVFLFYGTCVMFLWNVLFITPKLSSFDNDAFEIMDIPIESTTNRKDKIRNGFDEMLVTPISGHMKTNIEPRNEYNIVFPFPKKPISILKKNGRALHKTVGDVVSKTKALDYHPERAEKLAIPTNDRGRKGNDAPKNSNRPSIKRRIPVYYVKPNDRRLPVKRKRGAFHSEFEKALGHLRVIHRACQDEKAETADEYITIHNTTNDKDFVLILETDEETSKYTNNSAMISQEFLQRWNELVDRSAPIDWKVLTLSSFGCHTDCSTQYDFGINKTHSGNEIFQTSERLFRIRASKIYRQKFGDLWISWSPFYAGSLKAYLIEREGMHSLLENSGYDDRRSTNYNNIDVKDLFDEIVGFPDESIIDTGNTVGMTGDTNDRRAKNRLPPGLADGLIFSSVTGMVYSTTFPQVIQDASVIAVSHKDQLAASVARHPELYDNNRYMNYTIMVVTTMRVKNLDNIERDATWIQADADTLAKVHGKDSVSWKIRVAATKKDLLEKVKGYLHHKTPLVSYYGVQFDFIVVDGIFNKFVWVNEQIPIMNEYKRIIIKDFDQRISGMPWKMFLDRATNATIAAPLRETLHESLIQNRYEKTGEVPLVQAKAWMGGLWNKDKKRDDIGRMKNGGARLSSSWQLAQFSKARSLEVPFLEQYFIAMDGRFASWYFKQALTPVFLGQNVDWGIDMMWCAAAKVYSPNSTSCALVTVTSVHEDTKTIGWKNNGDYYETGRKIATQSRKSFPQWYNDKNYIHCFGCSNQRDLVSIESKCNISNGEDMKDEEEPIRCELNKF